MQYRYMMATKAMHSTGDISRNNADLCIIQGEEKDNWIGEWVTGFGFINVRFPKETTRELTDDEVKYYNSKHVQIGSQRPFKLKVR